MAPIYVGKGRGKRAMMHWISGTQNELFQRKLDCIRSDGLRPDVTIISMASEQVALDVEVGLIAIYGRISEKRGTLCNMTNGGDGYSVGSLSDDHKSKIASSMKGKTRSKTHCSNLSKSLTGKIHAKDTIEKLKTIAQAKASDPEFRKNISEKLKGRKLPPELALARAKQLKEMNQSPERRAQISAQMTARHAARRIEKLKATNHEGARA